MRAPRKLTTTLGMTTSTKREFCDFYDHLRATVERAVEEWGFRAVVVRHRESGPVRLGG